MSVLMPEGRQSFEDSAGIPLVGGKLYTYSAGTSVPLVTYKDPANVAQNTNPIILDGRGECVVFWQGSYKVVLTDAFDVVIWTQDNIVSTDIGGAVSVAVAQVFADLANTSDAAKGDALVGVRKTTTGAVSTTQHEVNERFIDVFDYLSSAQKVDVMAGTFTIDCRAAVQSAVAAAINGGIRRVRAPGKGYLINGVASSDAQLNGILFPFGVVNYAPADQIIFEGDGGGTVFRCGTAGMVMFRMARNCGILRDLTIDGNSLANTWGVGLIPESITQTTQVVSNSFCELHNVSRVNLTEGIVFQPGPRVGGSDSGCFYFNIYGGASDTNTRHIWLKKGATWATDGNRVTRTNFYGQRLVRGNTGYQFDAGTEINLIGCTEEFLASGVTPNATPTARIIGVACININFHGGYSEACTRSTSTPPRAGSPPIAAVHSFGYSFNSAPDIAEWRNNVDAIGDNVDGFNLTPVLASTGGGAPVGTITGFAKKMPGGLCFIFVTGSVTVGTLAAGSLSLSGLPFVPLPLNQRIPCPHFSGLTLGGTDQNISGLLAGGGNILLREFGSPGGDIPLTVSRITGTFGFTLQGVYGY